METRQRLWSRDFTLITGANFLMAIPFYFMMALMPLFITSTWMVGQKEVGLAMGAFTIAAVLLRPIAGMFLDSMGRKWVYFSFFLLFVSCLFSYSILGMAGFSLLVLIRVVHGASWGGVSTSSNTIAVDLVPLEKRGAGIGMFGISMTLAMAIGPLMAERIYGQLGSYSHTFIIGGAISVVALVISLLIRVPKLKSKQKHAFSWHSLFYKGAFPAGLFILFSQTPYGVLMTYSPLYAQMIGGAKVGLFFMMLAVGMFVGRVLSGYVFDRKGPRELVPTGALLLIAGFVLLAFTNTPVLFYSSAFLSGLGSGALTSSIQTIANFKVAPEKRGAANSTYLTMHDLGIGVGALLFGRIIASLGYQMAFLLCAVMVLVALSIFATFTYPRYKALEEL